MELSDSAKTIRGLKVTITVPLDGCETQAERFGRTNRILSSCYGIAKEEGERREWAHIFKSLSRGRRDNRKPASGVKLRCERRLAR